MREPDADLLRAVERYYTGRVEEHGPTARGVDWNSPESQRLRFRQLARLWETDEAASGNPIGVIDYGCGYGALLDYLEEQGRPFRYQGFDISEAMLREAAGRAGRDRRFTSDAAALERAEFVVASGVFNVKLDAPVAAWEAYVRTTVDRIAGLATRGFAFNALTAYSDPERRRPDLYYADPALWFDHCKRRHSRFVTLLHDYPLYEFTLLVRFET